MTDDAGLAERIRRLRNHGLINRSDVGEWGTVSRMDTLQAAILRIRLRHLPSVIARRRRNAALYRGIWHDAPVFIPPCRRDEFNTFHTFVVQTDRRDELQQSISPNAASRPRSTIRCRSTCSRPPPRRSATGAATFR